MSVCPISSGDVPDAITKPKTPSTPILPQYYDADNLPELVRKEGLSGKVTFLNFLKGMIGPACLSVPLVLREGGLLMGLFLIIFYGVLNNYCMLQLVHCSQYLSRKKGDISLDYGSVAYEACSSSFRWLRPYKSIAKFIVNAAIIALQIGICSVSCVFIGAHIQEIVEQYWSPGLSKQVYLLIILLPLILINYVRTLRIIAVISFIGMILMISSLLFIFQYLVRQEHQFGSLPLVTDFNGIMIATGSILYSFEGQAMVLPLENKLKHPEKMVGPFGVLSCGMTAVTLVYSVCGLLGYATYGEKVQGSITLNLPDQPIFTVIKGLFVLVVFLGYALQQYIIVEMTYPPIHTFLSSKTKILRRLRMPKSVIPELFYRTLLVLLEMSFAIAVPNLDQIIPLVGVTAGMFLALVFPAMLD
ncbi:hypothetical protein FO519_004764, partial [Halicephalobus sp. NKZ332]